MSMLDDRAQALRQEDRALPPRRILPLGVDEVMVETAWGGFVVVPAFNVDVAIGLLRDGVHEPWTTRLVQKLLRPGDICLNAGAGFGYFACLAGRRVGSAGRVVAVEPNPHLLPFLLKSLHWNGSHGHTEVFARALSDEAGREIACRFDPQRLSTLPPRCPAAEGPEEPGLPPDGRWSAATMGRLLDAEGRWGKGACLPVTFNACTTTIDRIADVLALPRIDLLHLDLGGAEPLALRGAQRVIAASPDLRLLARWSAAHHARLGERRRAAFEEMWDFMTRLGYAVRMLEPLIDRDGGIQLSAPLTHEAMTTIALPGHYLWTRDEDDPFG
ncbi:FkbM family methyltransferase [Falsiroseomonas sp.]|uniref:FkbM family methyltransferase n=1 Tax=Falsiroseomonas sp. TaxID=2870721 RepID=UPI003F6FF9F6